MTDAFEPTVNAAPRGPASVRTGIIVAACLAAVVAATAVLAAPPPARLESVPLAAGASASPEAEKSAKLKPDKLKVRGLGREIRITAINGNRVSLETADGWTRTITVTTETQVRKGGVAATVSDLKVGDRVARRQKRADDGTFSVTELVVPQPVLGGKVTAVTTTRITVKQRDGSSATIHVGSATTFKARRGAADTIGDIKVGDRVVAVGSLRSDGSLDATEVHVGGKGGPFKERGERGPKPDKSPKPSEAPTQGG
ncbi:hypothetical protein BH20CHL7_BH20CHL7_16690 [soil metagenome]